MWIVTVQVAREGAGPGRDFGDNASLITGVSQPLLDLLHKPQEATVVLEDVGTECWGWGAPATVAGTSPSSCPKMSGQEKDSHVRRYTGTATLRKGRR
jgi:4-oxalocrotonate tautomerase